ncbi:MAG: hypothetical protein MR038_08030 [Oscillospiraceae bacterium]|nr:hypothetical protein [Oscillospiraceae bacterium]
MDNKITDFRRLMNCGHGRCFYLLDGNEELFRDTVLYGCLNDISFDMQCEGARGNFIYQLVIKYEDPVYFLNAAAEKLLSEEVNTDQHMINHLCDFIADFAYDGNETAAEILEKKYSELYRLLMTTRWSGKQKEYAESFEYISIVLIQLKGFDRFCGIASDIGSYFIRRRRAEDDDLKWRFGWFFSCVRNRFGEDVLNKLPGSSPELRRFIRVMNHEEDKEERKKSPRFTSSEDILKRVSEGGKMFPIDVVSFGRHGSPEEKRKFAEMIVSETDIGKKAELLYMFSDKKASFPLDPEILIGYAGSEDERLKNAALDALCVINSDRVHEYALSLLKKEYSEKAVEMLINNYKDSDLELLMDILNSLDVSYEDTDWHDIVRSILDEAENDRMPDEAVLYIYNNSLCSFCREYAFYEMRRRGILTDQIIDECLYDCNSDIREAAEEILSERN